MEAKVREPAVAGSWYPGTADAIRGEVEGYLEAAGKVAVPGRLVGLISPHAGLRYSGPVAAYGYTLLRARPPASVVLVGPSHRVAFDGVAACARGSWRTPLGSARIDERLASAIVSAAPALIEERPDVHRDEHSLEMQLPFLQHVAPGLRIVPLMMGSQSRQEIDGLAQALASALRGQDVLLVASSDLSHYEPAPVANRRDALVTGQIGRFDDAALLGRLEGANNVACGGGPIVAVMRAARALGADTATVLRYGDSGDVVNRDKSHVVGYVSAALSARAS